MQQPSAPEADKSSFHMQQQPMPMPGPPMAPPSYNEAVGSGTVGWNVPQQPGVVGMQPLHPAPSHTVPSHPVRSHSVPAQPVSVQVVTVVMLGPKSVHTQCPNCRADVKTIAEPTFKMMAHAGCIALCVTGFWFCCCLPYCFDACKNVQHTCPNCKNLIGVYNG